MKYKLQITTIKNHTFCYDLRYVETQYGTLYQIKNKVPCNVTWNNNTWFPIAELLKKTREYYLYKTVNFVSP